VVYSCSAYITKTDCANSLGKLIDVAFSEVRASYREIYHNGSYRKLGEDVSKSSADVLTTIEKLAEKYNRIKR